MTQFVNFDPFVANDPAVAYASRRYDFLSALSDGKAAQAEISPYEMIQIIRKGLNKRTIYHLAELFGITIDQICDLVHISTRTLQRKDESESLGPLVSERALDLANVLVQGVNVLGSLQAMQSWLIAARPALGGSTPLSLLDTSLGCELVSDVLGRIEHGVHS
jgi:putative toxin-antitoxin system antitoxin component (TIGR02293 family)